MKLPSLEEALNDPNNVYVVWGDPWPACDSEQNQVTAHIESQATVQDVINIEREVYRRKGLDTNLEPRVYLEDFIVIHWASLKKHIEE